jgi:glutaredoxin
MKKYHLITKLTCPYCIKAEKLLQEKGLRYNTDPLDDEPTMLTEIQDQMGFSTVPIIWEIDERGNKIFIGGYTELVAHLNKKQILHG